MNVRELIEQLSKLDPATVVLTSGYEEGFAAVDLGEPFALQELSGMPEWVGRYLPTEVAAAELAGRGESGWQLMKNPTPPTLVGEPFTGVVLHRVGW